MTTSPGKAAAIAPPMLAATAPAWAAATVAATAPARAAATAPAMMAATVPAVAAAIAALKRDGTCHMGMSGTSSSSSSNFSLMPNTTCTLTPEAAAHTCNCVGVPQCGRGSKCNFDCSCDVPALRNASVGAADPNATLPRMLTDPDARPVFVGSIKFKDGKDFDVSCALPLDFRNATADLALNQTAVQKYLHGYEILIKGVGGKDRRCPDTESKPPAEQPLTMQSRYDCAVTPILADRPLVVGDVFQQKYLFSRAAMLDASVWLWLVVGFVVGSGIQSS